MPVTEVNRDALDRVVAVINGKGGVGKTTLTANIGGLLAASGWRVLLIDMDPQGNLGIDLGYNAGEQDDEGKGLSGSLLLGHALAPIRNVRENLDVVAGGDYLTDTEYILRNGSGTRGDTRLALAASLAPIADGYDVVLLDCPPGSKGLQAAAAAAARYLLIPTKSDKGSLEGLNITAGIIDNVADINPGVQLLGVIMFGSGKSSHNVRKRFGLQVAERLGVDGTSDLVFRSFIRHADSTAFWMREHGLLAHELEDKVQKAPKWYESLRAGKPREDVGPSSATTIADDMQAVVTEFIDRFQQLATKVGE